MRILSTTGTIIYTVLIASISTSSLAVVPTPFVTQDTIAEKTFSLQNHCGPTATWTYSRTIIGTDMRIDRTQIRKDALGVNCRFSIHSYMSTASDYSWIQSDKYDNSGTVLNTSYVWDSPIPKIKTSMGDQNMIGNAASSTVTPGHVVETTTLLGLEDITVPFGSFTGCIKLHTLRITTAGGDVSRITWRCPDVGTVKMIQGKTTDGSMSVWELTNIIMQ